ncbi:hypothetical protein CEXT_248621 [Caerostris extrusa]|uniref:Uncharacterized protein n=1 Tax=Caerostris extrusa TaxID=172846 RepID=A0AAV4U1C8_CAEEX|nr:hypothetical protein CEXT_248621 [Caerostris extrusa]
MVKGLTSTIKLPLRLLMDQVSVIEGSLGSNIESLLCVPKIPGVQECGIALIVCLANKKGELRCEAFFFLSISKFGEEDEKLVREAFCCVFPILLRAAAYEEERRLREECRASINNVTYSSSAQIVNLDPFWGHKKIIVGHQSQRSLLDN